MFELRRHGPITELAMCPTFLGRPMLPFRAYVVDGLLIDTGPPNMARQVLAAARELGVTQVVNTHYHEDHAGNNRVLSEQLGLVPLAHPLAVPLLAALAPIQLYRRLAWGTAADSIVGLLGDRLETPRYTFDVLHTPGHSADHIILHEAEQGWLFTGDLYIADRLKLFRPAESPRQLTASLSRARELAFGSLYCAHRGPVVDGLAALGRKYDYMEEFRMEVAALHQQGLTEREITRRLLGREGAVAYLSGGDFSRLNLVKSYLREAAPQIEASFS